VTQGYEVPADLLYTKEHEWVRASGSKVLVGITDYAAKTLNDVVYVTLPKVGDRLSQLKSMGTVESIKAVSELYAPLSGIVTKTNSSLDSHPELVNTSPYSEGWLIEVEPSDLDGEKRNLLDAPAYSKHIETLAKE
jgi:glycine cleavage system H protein